ncbi:SMC-Scp complex subunit ScpB [Candidatus Contubernalis alkaliaceticus]|uniref:SMC-Scp complex subunit ScpB n=1 Tax=Candidatus Contubernalis alkaliaceticus TaxID=338645 RepID=UPI001F4C06B4|nr:SMC-Scp complex subunit ScpB [Candidatus Contubernalis alkalaceticus]
MVRQKALLEALLFAAGKPLTIKKIKKVTGWKNQEIRYIFEELRSDYVKRESGLELREVAGALYMSTGEYYAPFIKKLFAGRERPGLSQAALESLAIIAYKQPITRLEIEAIRGVKVEKILDRLLGKNLIREVGRKDSIGRPILYGTTREFLQHFGLKSISQLHSMQENN